MFRLEECAVRLFPPPIRRSPLPFPELFLKGKTTEEQITLHTTTFLSLLNHISLAQNHGTETTCHDQSSPKQIKLSPRFFVLIVNASPPGGVHLPIMHFSRQYRLPLREARGFGLCDEPQQWWRLLFLRGKGEIRQAAILARPISCSNTR